MIKTLQKQLKQTSQQVRQTFLGIVARSAAKTLQLTGLEDEVLQDVEVIQHVGFASWIPIGAKVVIVPVGGKTGRSIVVGSTAAPIMIEVAEGETAIWDQFGHSILLKSDGIYIEGDLFVNGEVKDQKGTMQQIREIYNGHKHGNSPLPNSQM